MSRILEITNAWLIVANDHYGLFGKLIKGPPHLENFEAPVVENLFLVKVVKMSALSSSTNVSSGHFFRFVKYLPRLKATQAPMSGSMKGPFPLMEIKRPPQPLVDRIICPFSSVVGSAGDGNNEQSQFDCNF